MNVISPTEPKASISANETIRALAERHKIAYVETASGCSVPSPHAARGR